MIDKKKKKLKNMMPKKTIVYFNLTSSEYKRLVTMLHSRSNSKEVDPFVDLVSKLVMDHSNLLEEATKNCNLQFVWSINNEEHNDLQHRLDPAYS